MARASRRCGEIKPTSRRNAIRRKIDDLAVASSTREYQVDLWRWNAFSRPSAIRTSVVEPPRNGFAHTEELSLPEIKASDADSTKQLRQQACPDAHRHGFVRTQCNGVDTPSAIARQVQGNGSANASANRPAAVTPSRVVRDPDHAKGSRR